MNMFRAVLRASALALVALLAVAAFALASPRAAQAAEMGAGLPGITPEGRDLGNFIAPDGSRVYCIDSTLEWASGATSEGQLVDALTTTWGEAVASPSIVKLNYGLLAYGQTSDPVQAAAVAAFVNAYTGSKAHELGPGYVAGAYYINGNAAVMAVYDAIWADVENTAVTQPIASLSIEMNDARSGIVRVAATPAGATATLALHGAVVAESGAESIAVGNGSSVAVRGMPSDDSAEYAISVEARFSATLPASSEVVLFTTGAQQRLIRGSGPGAVEFDAQAATAAIPLAFSPVIHTEVTSQTVAIGQPFVDRLTVTVAEGPLPWRQRLDGSFVPVVADGVLYGPFDSAPATSTLPPEGAPIAAREQLTLTGPGEYLSSASAIASGPGYYTWVWSIDATQQEPASAAALPRDYRFASEFGIVEETHLVPAPPVRPAELARSGSEPAHTALVGIALLLLGVFTGIRHRIAR